VSDVARALAQLKADLRIFRRNPAALFFTAILPVIFLCLFVGIFGNQRLEEYGGVRSSTLQVPAFIALAVISAAFVSLAMGFTRMRENGVLKRVRATPVPSWIVFAGRIGTSIITALLTTALLMLIGAAISTFGYVSGMTLATPRALYAFGRDGFVPRALGAVHPRFHTPHVAIVVQTVIAFLLAASGTFIQLVNLANISVLLLYLTCCIAAWELRRRNVRAEGGIPFRVPGGGVIPWLAAAVIIGMLLSATQKEMLVVGLALGVATLVFFVTRSHRKTLKTVVAT